MGVADVTKDVKLVGLIHNWHVKICNRLIPLLNRPITVSIELRYGYGSSMRNRHVVSSTFFSLNRPIPPKTMQINYYILLDQFIYFFLK